MPAPKLAPHPRLYASREQLEHLRARPRLRFLREADEHVGRLAEQYLAFPRCSPLRKAHNAHLLRAREMQQRVVNLLARWCQTGDARCRDCAVAHVGQMSEWEYWSWITWRKSDPRPGAIFDLSYGVNSATLALAYDWLAGTLSDEECDLFLRTARERALGPFLEHTGEPRWPHWYCRPHSNWNAVCAGGAGLLALAMHDVLPQARRALPRADKSIGVFMRGLKESGGGWTEGIGYWNFGMCFALTYLLSHERSAGRTHPLLKMPEAKATLSFPPDFCPNGVPCSFGDSNHWRPMPIHYAAAGRLKQQHVESVVQQAAARTGASEADAAEWLLVHPGRATKPPRAERNVVKLYRGMDWGILADRMPGPRLYMAVRGGTTKVYHGHRDLLSYHCVVGDEAMITNLGVEDYLDITFSSRRRELFEVTPASKNVILINGVGIAPEATVATRIVRAPGARGFRIEATEAMGVSRDDEPAATFYGRLFLMLGSRAFLILDHVEMPHDGRVESRAHTYAVVAPLSDGAVLTGERQAMRVACACSVPALLHTAVTAPTRPGRSANVLRWCTDQLHSDVTMATLLSPGTAAASLRLDRRGKTIGVRAEFGGRAAELTISTRLRFPRGR